MIENIQQLNWADYVIIAIIGISILISLIRGFIREILSLAIWIAAFVVAFKFSGRLADVFIPYTQNESLRVIIGFAILFLIVLILGGLISYLINVLIKKTKLTFIDRILGIFFGFIRGVLLIAVLLLLFSIGSKKHEPWWTESYLIPHFQGIVTWMHDFMPNKLKEVTQIDTDVIIPEVTS